MGAESTRFLPDLAITGVVDMQDIERVILAAAAVSGDYDKAITWLKQPIDTFDGQTALQLINEDRADEVIRYLQSFESGYIG